MLLGLGTATGQAVGSILARPVMEIGPPKDPGHRPIWMSIAAAGRLLGNAGDRAMAASLLR